ncbi:hypothetical protein [Paenibacillus sp. IHBB 3054]|uniref:hypothetical protein n=1 Tax=Paenibacillus sp. IHBB 3054 TaxID=3425689 RepID=UPI003F67EDF4
MSDWLNDIKDHITEHNRMKNLVTAALKQVVREIKESGIVLGESVELVVVSPLTWEVSLSIVSIGSFEFRVSYKDITQAGGSRDDVGQFISAFPEDLEAALKQIIVAKIKAAINYDR